MFRALLPIVAGVILADCVTFPLWSVAVGFVLSIAAAWWLKDRAVADLYLVVAFVLVGVMAAQIRRGVEPTPQMKIAQQGALAEIEVNRVTSSRANTLLCDGRLVAIYAGDSAPVQVVGWPVRIEADTSIGVQMGSRLMAYVQLRLYDERSDNRYESYMARRGVVGQIRLYAKSVLQHRLAGRGVVRWLHDKALQRLHRLSLDERSRTVVEAMTIGERASIATSLRQEYARSGSAHLLAVSGLHVGFVFAIINLLLAFFALFRHGQLWRVVPAVAAIWIYAAVAGASPSVVRAAVMFTLLQLAFVVAARTQALNSLAFTASVMIVWNASLLYDVGFLLSFAAVAGIVVWGAPLSGWHAVTKRPFEKHLSYKSWRRDLLQRVVVLVWQAVAVSVAASVATMPLTAYMFGVVSLWSVVVGPLMILLGMAVVSVAMVWILLPIGVLQGFVSWLLGALTHSMNGIAELCSRSGALIWEGYISGGVCAVCYLLFAVVTLLLWSRQTNNPQGYSSKSSSSSI